MPAAQAADKSRLAYLDNLRTFLTALVICHHSAISQGASGGWYYVVPPPEGSLAPILLTIFAAINQAFFMSLFFAVSAFFTPRSYDKKGPASYMKDRLARLGIPLVAYFFVLNPSVVYLVYRFAGRTQDGYLDFMLHSGIYKTGTGPLWFVMTLLIFAALYAALRITASGSEMAARARSLPTNRQVLGFVIGVGLFTFLVRLWFPAGWAIIGMQLGYYPLYVCMYVFGVWASRHSWFDDLQPKQANLWFYVSLGLIALLPVLMVLGGALKGGTQIFMGGASWQAYAYAAWEPVLCVGISMKLLVLFRARCNRENGATRRMARSAYTAYILHPFFVVCGTYLVTHLPVDPLVRFVALCPLAVGTCFLVSNAVRQAPLLRRIL